MNNKVEEILEKYGLEKENVYAYLDALRESGEVNMFGATSHLRDFFGLDKIDARTVLMNWMEDFNK